MIMVTPSMSHIITSFLLREPHSGSSGSSGTPARLALRDTRQNFEIAPLRELVVARCGFDFGADDGDGQVGYILRFNL